jgi:NAD(P)-dependent dehydrogenase (short-subunit alcohol dehydrogenase family)
MTESTFLSGRNALVMGAGNEAAEAVALALAEAGADVALTTATPDAEEAFGLRRLSRQIDALGRRSVIEVVDMNIGTNVQVAVRQVAKQLGSIDILVTAPGLKPERGSDRLGAPTGRACWATT